MEQIRENKRKQTADMILWFADGICGVELLPVNHFWMNYSFRNLTWKVKNKKYTKLLLTSSENL